MKSSIFCSYSIVLAASAVLGLSSNVAAQPFCGSTIVADTTLTADLLGCPDRGLRIGASDVTLDCNGHTIEAAGNRAVEVNFGQSNVTVKNCVLVSTANTDALRVAGDSSDIVITANDITTSGFQSRGIRMNGTTRGVIANNRVVTSGGSSDGIRLFESSDSLVSANSVSTSGDSSRGFRIGFRSRDNLITGNVVETAGNGAAGVLLRAGADGNVVERNIFFVEKAKGVRIESASNNVLQDNAVVAARDWLRSRRFTLQNGGLSVDPGTGRIFAVENNFGSSNPSAGGLGVATALIEVNLVSGRAENPVRLVQGGVDINFGFDALEILPNGRFIALRGGNSGEIYEIDPVSGEVSFIFNGPGINGLEAVDNFNLIASNRFGALFDVVLGPGLPMVTPRPGSPPGWTDIAIDSSGKAFVISRHTAEASLTNHLYSIDLPTGVAAEIGDTGLAFISDIEFAADGTLYGNGGELLFIDVNTAETESVGAFGEDPFEPPSLNNILTKTTLVASDGTGSVHYPGPVSIPDGVSTDVTTEDIKISYNRVFVDANRHPFLDRKAVITFLGLPGDKRRLLIDRDDDGTFERCRGNQCKLRLFKGGTLVFEVDGFTTYSSEERVKGSGNDE